MTPSDEAHLERAVGRIWRITGVLSAAGALAFLGYRGWRWAEGFALGAGLSVLNFRWLKQVAMGLGSTAAKPRMAVLLGLRYLLLGGGAYVILKYSAISVAAMFWGLFVCVAAVILEILIELAYGIRTLDH
jgi:hypothetical protein